MKVPINWYFWIGIWRPVLEFEKGGKVRRQRFCMTARAGCWPEGCPNPVSELQSDKIHEILLLYNGTVRSLVSRSHARTSCTKFSTKFSTCSSDVACVCVTHYYGSTVDLVDKYLSKTNNKL